MKYYTETIPAIFAEILKEKGMPMTLWQQGGYDFIEVLEKRQEIFDDSTYEVAVRYEIPLYCEVFDWLMIRYGAMILIVRHERKWDWWIGLVTDNDTYECSVEIEGELSDTWHEAANAAIEKALTLI